MGWSILIKYLAIPLILVGCTAPVTHPPAEACSPPLNGSDFKCPPPDVVFVCHLIVHHYQTKPLNPKEQVKR